MKDKYFELVKWEMFQQNFHKESDVAEKESGSIVGNGRLIFRVSCFFSSPDGCHFEHFEVIRWKWRGTEMSIILIFFYFLAHRKLFTCPFPSFTCRSRRREQGDNEFLKKK